MAASLHSPSAPARFALADLPKSNVFATQLPPDPRFPTPLSSHETPRERIGPQLVKNALYTYVRPAVTHSPALLAVSARALQDLAIDPAEVDTPRFRQVFAGNDILTWDEETGEGIYPWAQCYGGYQFGQWAGQLGDGRAISLFETTNPNTGVRYELQLKGAGRTPYSRFADGKAVLRSSIREFVASEYLNAIGIPTTRALALTLCPREKVVRDRIEPGAIVARFAQSWLRIGTFDLPHARGDRLLLRKLAEYTAEHAFGGWDKLPSKIASSDVQEGALDVGAGVPKAESQGTGVALENRFARLYRAVVRANAKTVAAWQAYGFINGVLNTDNTSILGLSIDFGPFAFLDTFDEQYTPNHDDYMLRYSYRNQPPVIKWNLVKLGEALAELIGAGDRVDDATFIANGVGAEESQEFIKRAEDLIQKRTIEEYDAVFTAEYESLMKKRLGLKALNGPSLGKLVRELLDGLAAHELDFHHAFRRLSSVRLSELETQTSRMEVASRFFGVEPPTEERAAKEQLATWLEKWCARAREDWGDGKDEEREAAMKQVNPKVKVLPLHKIAAHPCSLYRGLGCSTSSSNV